MNLMSRPVTALRAGMVLLALGATMWWLRPSVDLAAAVLRDPQRVVDTEGADAVFLLVAELGLLGLCVWIGVLTVLVAATAGAPTTPVGRLTLAVTPAAMRRPLALALGIGTVALTACTTPDAGGGSAPSTAPLYAASSEAFDWPQATADPGADQVPASPAADDSAPGPSPSGAVPAASVADPPAVTVRDGDCLWSIAGSQLGPGASTAEVAYLVDALYAMNATAIGGDPDLLTPGTTLILPVS